MNKTLFFRILAFAKPYSRFWPKYVLLIIPATIFGVINFALIIPVLEVVFEQKEIKEIVVNKSFSFEYIKSSYYLFLYHMKLQFGVKGVLTIICLSVLLASLLSNLFKYLAQRVINSMRVYVIMNIRNALFDKVTRLHVGFFNEQRKGQLISTFSNDINEVQNTVINAFQIMFKEPIMIIGSVCALLYMSLELTLFAVVAVPLSSIFIVRLTRKLKKHATRAQLLQGELLSVLEETITGIRIIKGFNAQRYIRGKFHSINEAHRNSSNKVFNKHDMASPLSEFFGVTVVLMILFFGGILVMSGNLKMSSSEFIVYLAFYYQILVPIKELTKSYASIQRGSAAADRLFNVLDQPIDVLKTPNPISISKFEESIEFENVSFNYTTGGNEILHNINLKIPKGKMYALVGHSGAGKSTLADLIPRFYDVTFGEIKLDRVNIKDYQPRELISLMGIVSQESILFNDTVYNNIAFGWDGATDENVHEAAIIANAHEFIEKMDGGYQANIGDRGGKLSGGQRQRLAIARAVLRNPPILILDEATSALDTKSERLVQDALVKLMQNRTSIVIAHRLSTIKNADCIIVLNDGNIIEQGKHDDLISKDGAYASLCRMQNFE